ncbi:protein YIPF3-like isoform X1 [Littorina saxatilis]|uniref:Protein YIPF3 n=1 Tax=Littorina saxatilis TaxID=31220 RepID=A0AAN9G891_9CAEN
MADPSPWQATRPTNQGSGGSAVLSMEPEDVDSDGGHHDYDDPDMSKDSQGRNEGSSPGDDFRQRMSQNMTQMMWQAGTQGAKKAWNVYGNIDILRPYFNVEPREVRRRLLYSLIPRKPTAQKQEVPRELYGPVMVVLTMIALLLYQMKSADHKVADGTLMGSALGTCFMYWLGASGLVWLLAYVCSVRIVMVQILSMIGYGMFGHCIVLFLGTVIHTSHDHLFFYLLWALVGGLSTLRMVCIIMSRASGKTERIVVMATLAALHLLFLLYLHFAYHTVVEELSQVFDSQLVPEPQSAAAADSVMEKSQAAVP